MSKKYSFKGGIELPPNKNRTENLPIELYPAPQTVVLPLIQQTNTPLKPVVKRGDHVKLGQIIGQPCDSISVPVHSSVSGTVLSVGLFPFHTGRQNVSIEIGNDGMDETESFVPFEKSWRDAAPGELVQKILASGIIGMGGEGYPTHQKLSPPSNKPIETLIINGVECEPYLTSDYRLMIERADDLMMGILILKKIIGAKRCIICIGYDKTKAINEIDSRLSDSHYKEFSICATQTKYPQGSEKQLIRAVLNKEVPSGGLPMDIGCIIHNIATVIAVRDAIIEGKPLYQRVLTVSGPATNSPKNLLVRFGTPIRSLLETCNIDMNSTKKLILGGPMMGIAQSELDIPVTKFFSGILAFNETTPGIREYPCINCGNCVEVCPIRLVPSQIVNFVKYQKIDDAVEWNIHNCIECGSCSYICPSKINLVHFIKLGKYLSMHTIKQ